jgi:hypothetical protein
LQYPDRDTFFAAVKHRNEIFQLERDNEIEMKQFNKELEKKQMVDARYKRKLEGISALIKNNPLILKYIYIDKMADNIKMILPINASGYPLDLNDVGKKYSEQSDSSKEIDNLR